MATFHKGNGGKATVGGTDVNITDWEFTKKTRAAETTHSGTAGWVTFKGTTKEAEGTINVVWDSDQIPDTDITMDVGDEITLALFVGDSAKFYSMTAMIETLKLISKNTEDVVRWTVTFKGWAVTDPVT